MRNAHTRSRSQGQEQTATGATSGTFIFERINGQHQQSAKRSADARIAYATIHVCRISASNCRQPLRNANSIALPAEMQR